MKSGLLAAALLIVLVPSAFSYAPQSASGAGDFDALSRRASEALKTNPQEAATLYRQGLALRPSWPEGWFYLGASLFEEKQYAESRKAFEKAAQLAPTNGSVWGFLGLCEYQMNDDAQALADLRKGEAAGLPDDLKFVSAVRNRAAVICIRSSDFSAAVEQLQALALLGDKSRETIENLGLSTLGIARSLAEMSADKQAVVELAGRASWALYAERSSDASALFHQLITQYPNEPGVHYLYGIYLLDRDPDGATREFRKELQITPSHVPARLQIAILDIKAGDAGAALKLAEEAIKLQPANPLAHAVAGRAFAHQERFDKAIAELETAVKLAPENAQLHFSLAQAYRRLGRTADAEKEVAEFNRLKPARNAMLMPEQDDAPDRGIKR